MTTLVGRLLCALGRHDRRTQDYKVMQLWQIVDTWTEAYCGRCKWREVVDSDHG